ncbi:UdgX family uracil-DNA binding protein [Crateriforma spongiae]|uniref:UdgX family uracil-DNA binding protein n=1 Tax=Crateriforma spongiae TaxID=2724528 RepID=UPI001445626B|nr:UdgX family uracil-DNA binding protein [Crateriforma spongiae]
MTASEELMSVGATHFNDWRNTARRLVTIGAHPSTVRWIDQRGDDASMQKDLFENVAGAEGGLSLPASDARESPPSLRVPGKFIQWAKTIASHSAPGRWELLYRLLWRMTGGERHLLQIASDPDVRRAAQMHSAVRRDAHKTKAFVRFRKTVDQIGELFVAWHRPDHYSLDLTADFFARRFDVMRWTIMTPRQSVYWDGQTIHFGDGSPRSDAPDHDQLEELWKTYYAHIFNPARIKLDAMRAEMPKKHWPTMPETSLIDDMLRDAPQRVRQMVRHQEGGPTAKSFLPKSDRTLASLCNAAMACEGCDIHRDASRVVFGRGPADAKLVIVGEQPGDMEDRSGEPFIGPAGQLLRRTMAEVGLDATQVYITNAVKHFKFKLQGKRRLHVKPSSREIAACRPWLEAELDAIRPAMILCLGATAASVIKGPNFRITRQRGEVDKCDHAKWAMATYHPSALLRVPDENARARMMAMFTEDLRRTAEHHRILNQS